MPDLRAALAETTPWEVVINSKTGEVLSARYDGVPLTRCSAATITTKDGGSLGIEVRGPFRVAVVDGTAPLPVHFGQPRTARLAPGVAPGSAIPNFVNTTGDPVLVLVEEAAQVAYAAYGATTDYKNYQGLAMPAWPDLPSKIRDAWRAAACAVADLTKGNDQ